MKLLHAIASEYIFSLFIKKCHHFFRKKMVTFFKISPKVYFLVSISTNHPCCLSSNGLLAQPQKNATVQPAPFVKPHCVLIVADATVLLINRRTSVWLNCRQKIIKNDLLNSCQCDKIEISEI